MEDVTEQRKEFYERLEKHIQTNINKSKRDKYVVTREMMDTALSLLKVGKGQKCDEGARLKFWVKEKFYPNPSGTELICKKTHKPAVVKEDFFDVIHAIHCNIGHRKRENTWKEVCAKHSWVKRDIIDIYITTCRVCCGEPMGLNKCKGAADIEVSNQGFMIRMAVSVINMEDMPDGVFRYILVVRDFATKFTAAWPLRNNTTAIISCLLQFFGQFGPPKFLHACEKQINNMGEIIFDLRKLWPNLTILQGRPNHPEFEPLVERACADLQNKLGAWMAQCESNSSNWADGIGQCVFQMNSAISPDNSRSPFQSVFNTGPTEADLLWKTVTARGWTKEVHLPPLIVKMFEKYETGVSAMTKSPLQSPDKLYSPFQNIPPIVIKREKMSDSDYEPDENDSQASTNGSEELKQVGNNELRARPSSSVQPSSSLTSRLKTSDDDMFVMECQDEGETGDEVTPDSEIVVKIERDDEGYGGQGETTPSGAFTYTY